MPELPEVETVKRTLENFILNKKIKDIEVIYPRIIEDDVEVFKQRVVNKTFLKIDRVGKYLIFILEDIAFVSHLRMEGKYQICTKETSLSKHDHVIFYLDDDTQLRYNDVRKFGRMKLVDKESYKTLKPLNQLGKEPFEADVNEIYQRLKNKDTTIKTALLDQTLLAGIGNIYANEICYAMHLNPQTKAKALSKKRVKELIEVSSFILNEAIKQGGTTIHSFSANGIDGLFQVQLKVHMQEKCPQGHDIKKISLNGRGTYYCPICQKARR